MNADLAVKFLSKDVILHIDMLESIRSDGAEILYSSEHGVLLYNTASRAYMMSAEDNISAEQMLHAVKNAELFVAHQNFYVDRLQNKFSFSEKMECFQAAYLKKTPLPEIRSDVAIRPLNENHLPFIMEHYSHADDEDYQRERLCSGKMFGAFLKDHLIGFIGIHAEGSMGMLEVLPEYRRRGLALSLETFLSNRLLAQKKVPFSQIVADNEMSLRLHRKLGFSLSASSLFWTF